MDEIDEKILSYRLNGHLLCRLHEHSPLSEKTTNPIASTQLLALSFRRRQDCKHIRKTLGLTAKNCK